MSTIKNLNDVKLQTIEMVYGNYLNLSMIPPVEFELDVKTGYQNPERMKFH